MGFAKFFVLSFGLCARFVARIAFATLLGWCVDRYFAIFPIATVALSVCGVYLGFKALVAVSRGKYTDA